jgi:hypothetical protein
MNFNQTLLAIDAVFLFFVAAIHFYWAFGAKWGANAIMPQINSRKKVFSPSPIMTLTVVIPFLLMGLIFAQAASRFSLEIIDSYLPILLLILVGIFTVSVVGDFNNVGFFKKVMKTEFAKNDSKYFTPICAFVAFRLMLPFVYNEIFMAKILDIQ